MRILVTSDDPETLERAAKYTALFADPDDSTVTLMGIYESEKVARGDHRRFVVLGDVLSDKVSCPIVTKLRYGRASEQVLNETEQNHYDLVVLGIHLRRRWSQLRPKHVAQHIARRIRVPLLVAFPEWQRLRRILICIGERPQERIFEMAGRLAASAGAEITVLHVMSQIPISADAKLEDLERDADELIHHDAREGRALQRALDALQNHGIPPEKCEAKLRRGLLVDEIVRESEEGDFDLVVIGAHQVSTEQPWHELRELVQEDVAERILMNVRRPVLIVRSANGGEECEN